jgi:cyanate lyase
VPDERSVLGAPRDSPDLRQAETPAFVLAAGVATGHDGPTTSGRGRRLPTARKRTAAEDPMDKATMSEAILAAKAAKGLTWARIAEALGLSEIYTASACFGENVLSPDEATMLCQLLGLEPDVGRALATIPLKGEGSPQAPKDPLIYRFQEITYVYGRALKEIIEERFGAGIMSAIDFTLDVEKVPDPKGDRVKVVMCGKFLPYKMW